MLLIFMKDFVFINGCIIYKKVYYHPINYCRLLLKHPVCTNFYSSFITKKVLYA